MLLDSGRDSGHRSVASGAKIGEFYYSHPLSAGGSLPSLARMRNPGAHAKHGVRVGERKA
jgi:hypothetical protein